MHPRELLGHSPSSGKYRFPNPSTPEYLVWIIPDATDYDSSSPRSPHFDMIYENDTTAFSAFLSASPDHVSRQSLNQTDPGLHLTALQLAVMLNRTEIFNLLLQQSYILPDERSPKKNWTPLIIACACGRVDMVRKLLAREDVDANACDEDGISCLLWALRARRQMRKRWDSGAQLNHGVCMSGNDWRFDWSGKILPQGIEERVDWDDWGVDHPFWVSEEELDRRLHALSGTVHALLNHMPPVDASKADCQGRTALEEAAVNWSSPLLIQRLLERNEVNPNVTNCYGWTPLVSAIASVGEIKLLSSLLSHPKTDLKAPLGGEWGVSPVYMAAYKRNISVMKLLLESGASPQSGPSYYPSPLSCAILNEVRSGAESLVEHGALLESCDEHGWSPALCAAHSLNHDIKSLTKADESLTSKVNTKRPTQWQLSQTCMGLRLRDLTTKSNDISGSSLLYAAYNEHHFSTCKLFLYLLQP